jgi:hypothetical protein
MGAHYARGAYLNFYVFLQAFRGIFCAKKLSTRLEIAFRNLFNQKIPKHSDTLGMA